MNIHISIYSAEKELDDVKSDIKNGEIDNPDYHLRLAQKRVHDAHKIIADGSTASARSGFSQEDVSKEERNASQKYLEENGLADRFDFSAINKDSMADYNVEQSGNTVEVTGVFNSDVHDRLKRLDAFMIGASKKGKTMGGSSIDFKQNQKWVIPDASSKVTRINNAFKTIASKSAKTSEKVSSEVAKKEAFKNEKNSAVNVPFDLKDDVKKMFGARWDVETKKWHVSKDDVEKVNEFIKANA